MTDETNDQDPGIVLEIVDFSMMAEGHAVRPGFYYTFPVETPADAEPQLVLNGPYPDQQTAHDKAMAYLKEAFRIAASDEDVDFVEDEDDAAPPVEAV